MRAAFVTAPGPGAGQRLVIHHAAATTPPRSAVLALHAFGEEMNKSRRMVALAARALAAAGHAVLQIDLRGCGDSSGDWADTAYADWIDDAALGAELLAREAPGAPLVLWGHRAGALLARALAERLGAGSTAPLRPGPALLLWQPQASGRQVVQQFLRLKLASQMQQGAPKGLTDALQRELAAGQAVEVAGYRLGPALAAGLGAATLDPLPGVAAMAWLEVTTREPAALLPAGAALIERWRAAGTPVFEQAVSGPPFWQTLEIEDAPALVPATVAAADRLAAVLAGAPA